MLKPAEQMPELLLPPLRLTLVKRLISAPHSSTVITHSSQPQSGLSFHSQPFLHTGQQSVHIPAAAAPTSRGTDRVELGGLGVLRIRVGCSVEWAALRYVEQLR